MSCGRSRAEEAAENEAAEAEEDRADAIEADIKRFRMGGVPVVVKNGIMGAKRSGSRGITETHASLSAPGDCKVKFRDGSVFHFDFYDLERDDTGGDRDYSQVEPAHTSDSDDLFGALPVYEAVDGPKHYDGDECMQAIEKLGLNFRLGNVFKYLWRSGRKGARLEDLKKARWYLTREIEAQE